MLHLFVLSSVVVTVQRNFHLTVLNFASTTLVSLCTLDPKLCFTGKSNGVTKSQSAFVAEIRIVFWLEELPEQLMSRPIKFLSCRTNTIGALYIFQYK